MQNPPYNILIVEDDKIDQLAFKRAMKEYSSLFVYTIADNFEKACNFLEHNDFDLIISDFNLGDGTGLDIVKKYGHIPTIMVTASDDIEAAVNSLRNGARDYIVKDRLSKYLEVLPLTAKKVLDHFQAEIKARDSEERFRELFENSSDLIQSVSVEGNFNYVNPEWKKVLKYNDEEIKNINLLDIIYPEDRKHCKEMLDELFSGIDFKSTEIRFISK
ncbi:MAG: response regulator, partial [Cyclobacteriaceae bacterium]|nr:response regulator [Cyclobacteriaceae bacterium]